LLYCNKKHKNSVKNSKFHQAKWVPEKSTGKDLKERKELLLIDSGALPLRVHYLCGD